MLTPRYDIGRFGSEIIRATPRQSDLLIVSGRVSHRMAAPIRELYEQMLEPKWVMAMGACSSTGGMFANYAILQGVDKIIPVDIYVPGCPPRPEAVIEGVMNDPEEDPGRHPARLRAAAVAGMSARADADALAAGLGAGVAVSEAHGEVTVDVPRERIADACAAARDAGYDFLCDLAATDYLGFAGEGVAGYWASPAGSGGARHQPPGLDRASARSSRRPATKRFAISYQLLDRSARPARRLRLRVWADDGEAVPSVVGVFPCADYQEREAWDLMGIAVRRASGARADLPARGLGRPSAPQGLPHRRRAGAVLGRGLMSAHAPTAARCATRPPRCSRRSRRC